MVEEFKSNEEKEIFFKVRIRYPEITAKTWYEKKNYIESLKYLTSNGEIFTLKNFIFQYFIQDGLCQICADQKIYLAPMTLHTSEPVIVIDHNHLTMKVRGLLCSRCNTLLGQAHEDITNLCRAIEYLKKYGNYELYFM